MYDFLGVRTDPAFRPFYVAQPAGNLVTEYPRPDQTYFELTEILRAAAANREQDFVFLELGGAYGHWAAKVARARAAMSDRPTHLVVAEMEPQRFSRIDAHFRNNGLDPSAHVLVNAAVSDHSGEAWFADDEKAHKDYGLSLARGLWRSEICSPRRPEDARRRGVRVRCTRLSELLRPWPSVNLVHVDIQGEEWVVLREARALLRKRVGRLIIATHSLRLHLAARSLLKRDGWLFGGDYFPHGVRRTPFGHVYFHDGLLVARSPAAK